MPRRLAHISAIAQSQSQSQYTSDAHGPAFPPAPHPSLQHCNTATLQHRLHPSHTSPRPVSQRPDCRRRRRTHRTPNAAARHPSPSASSLRFVLGCRAPPNSPSYESVRLEVAKVTLLQPRQTARSLKPDSPPVARAWHPASAIRDASSLTAFRAPILARRPFLASPARWPRARAAAPWSQLYLLYFTHPSHKALTSALPLHAIALPNLASAASRIPHPLPSVSHPRSCRVKETNLCHWTPDSSTSTTLTLTLTLDKFAAH
ncbi:hypothetical protein SNOG_15058 [Parastagonospora nodorum SN15]|uniref:Uncharacterized protein n=1 Tax=Phaeosphaeria nodorum (strain SN15 / ATCC MYA-4574 / FGSC 10173) TaxID=321614 RepID=Q0TZP9_PHANO|nr:hypothetical protein SNOG_15058 [Parastagonospora nodorum SN15]EAT77601.1 hypothetical protein SNOG_15058 [Parastagonospora nodorum SN15]